jgi:hypothetical protein
MGASPSNAHHEFVLTPSQAHAWLSCCVAACVMRRSIEFRLRLPGIDLWTTHKPAWSEVALQFMLLGAVYLHK